jgi:hypothetical protein
MRTLPNQARQTVRRAIGEQLRAAYEETVQEPTPSRHLDLLQQLERNETVQKPVMEPAQDAHIERK